MEKLLQLLNEYSPLKYPSEEYCIEDGNLWIKTRIYAEPDVYTNYTLMVISKKFWFIERLVANDKLNKEWLFNIIRESCIFNDMNICSESDYIIMYLAIGYNPIYFLTSMVK